MSQVGASGKPNTVARWGAPPCYSKNKKMSFGPIMIRQMLISPEVKKTFKRYLPREVNIRKNGFLNFFL